MISLRRGSHERRGPQSAYVYALRRPYPWFMSVVLAREPDGRAQGGHGTLQVVPLQCVLERGGGNMVNR